MISRVFSSVTLNVGSVTAKFLDLFRNFTNWSAALSSFFNALGFKLTCKQMQLLQQCWPKPTYTRLFYFALYIVHECQK